MSSIAHHGVRCSVRSTGDALVRGLAERGVDSSGSADDQGYVVAGQPPALRRLPASALVVRLLRRVFVQRHQCARAARDGGSTLALGGIQRLQGLGSRVRSLPRLELDLSFRAESALA